MTKGKEEERGSERTNEGRKGREKLHEIIIRVGSSHFVHQAQAAAQPLWPLSTVRLARPPAAPALVCQSC